MNIRQCRDIGRKNGRYQLPASKWANPFTVKREADRETAIASYARWLRGLDLVCWCAPLPCHGDVLLRLANEEEEEPPCR
jgi:hypothetical protein